MWSRAMSPSSPLPRARGDHPLQAAVVMNSPNSSPRAWGSSADDQSDAVERHLFPTRVGIIRAMPLSCRSPTTLPHARGDHPCVLSSIGRVSGLFPTRVGIIRLRCCVWAVTRPLPHARRDHPYPGVLSDERAVSSSRTWGSSGAGNRGKHHGRLFPTCVGIIRSTCRVRTCGSPLPRTHEDDLDMRSLKTYGNRASPQTRGSSEGLRKHRPRQFGFPARAGIIRSRWTWKISCVTLPRTRAGIACIMRKKLARRSR